MRLADFIETNLEPILQTWENFARHVETPLPSQDAQGLRNHAEHILHAVAADIRTPQTEREQIRKSKGLAAASPDETAAQTHAVLRLIDGFTMDQMVSEYRALRSSVLRLWLASPEIDLLHQVDDMVRFNEAIDQALVESIASYGRAVELTRKMVLGVLGHDLRAPLSAILMGSDLLANSRKLEGRERDIAVQIGVSARRGTRMVNDLVDLARFNLGIGIPVVRVSADLSRICRNVIGEISVGQPEASIEFINTRPVHGQFDPDRMAQVFANLIGNAVRYGDIKRPVQVTLEEEGAFVRFEVRNLGTPIPPAAMPYLFNPEGRYSSYSGNEAPPQGLGLGLFIAAQVVSGHEGKISVESTVEEGTCFRVDIPHRPRSVE
ncbi:MULTISPECIES: sensor histidine kinase [unclassified Pseudomonas]|uniref:sensor histidine kinase n=1 Tax=unclassified Pseudomonas TaxID=196821 RepID=UPI0035C186EF